MITARNSLARLVGAIQTDRNVESVFLGGSVLNGTDDEVSDLDLWVVTDDWSPAYLEGLFVAGQTVEIGGAPLFHGVDHLGVIVDIRHGRAVPPEYGPLDAMTPDPWIVVEIEPAGLYTNFWISSYKHRKPMWRELDGMALLGLHFDRVALLMAWVAQETGAVPGPEAFSIHGLTPLVRDYVTPERRELLGSPTGTRKDLLTTIQAYRIEMLRMSPPNSRLARIVMHDPLFAQMLVEAGG